MLKNYFVPLIVTSVVVFRSVCIDANLYSKTTTQHSMAKRSSLHNGQTPETLHKTPNYKNQTSLTAISSLNLNNNVTTQSSIVSLQRQNGLRRKLRSGSVQTLGSLVSVFSNNKIDVPFPSPSVDDGSYNFRVGNSTFYAPLFCGRRRSCSTEQLDDVKMNPGNNATNFCSTKVGQVSYSAPRLSTASGDDDITDADETDWTGESEDDIARQVLERLTARITRRTLKQQHKLFSNTNGGGESSASLSATDDSDEMFRFKSNSCKPEVVGEDAEETLRLVKRRRRKRIIKC